MKASTSEHNAITERIDRLQNMYNRFRRDTTAVMLHWKIRQDEVKMLDAFVKYENSECGVFPDFFFPLNSPFKSIGTYDQSLLDEVNSWIENDTKNLKEEGYKLEFPLNIKASSTVSFLHSLSSFAQSIPELDYVVAVLDPLEVSNFDDWESWMINLVSNAIPPKVRLMVFLSENYSELIRLKREGQTRVICNVPDLDMPGAMRQLASTGDPSDPSIQYRLLLLDMGQAAGGNHLDKMKSLGEKALSIAQQQGWEQLEASTHAAIGSFLLPHSKYQKEALQFYQKGFQVAKRTYGKDPAMGAAIFIQAHHFIAAAHLTMRNYEDAAKIYQAAVGVAKNDQMFAFQEMESWRMAGYCNWQMRQLNPALNCYWAALETANILSQNTQAQMVFLSIGAALRELIQVTGEHSKESTLHVKMTQLVGEDWIEKIKSQEIRP